MESSSVADEDEGRVLGAGQREEQGQPSHHLIGALPVVGAWWSLESYDVMNVIWAACVMRPVPSKR